MRFVRSRSLLAVSLVAVLGVACGVDAEGVGVGTSADGGTGGRAGAGARAGASNEGGAPGKAGEGGAAGKSGGAQGGSAGKGGAAGTAGASGKGGLGGAAGAATSGNGGDGGSDPAGGSAGGGVAGKGGQAGNGGASGATTAGAAGAAGGSIAGGGGSAGAGTSGAAGTAGGGMSGAAGAAGGNGGTAGATAGQAGAAGNATGGASGTGGTAGASGAGGAPPVPVCGDGRVNTASEECDDGNTIDTDACTNACLVRCPAFAPGVTDAGAKNPATDRCYFTSLATQSLAPTLGTNACIGPGVHIATIHDARDQAWIAQGVPAQGYRAWIGGRRDPVVTFGPNAFAWYEGGPVAGTFWAPGEPNPPEDACLTLRETDLDGGLGVDRRYRYASSSCTRAAESPLPTLCVREPTCRIGTLDGIVGDGGHCYVVSPSDLASFAAAKTFCVGLGGHLATFETPEELARLGGVGFRNVWIGATQTVAGGATNAGWRWSEGPTPTAAVSDQLWLGGEPNDGGGKAVDSGAEDCASLLNGTRRLNDAPCGQTINRALCEFE